MPKSKTNSARTAAKRRSPKKEAANRPSGSAQRNSKTAVILKMLKSQNGSDLAELTRATKWQPHSVRGFLSGHIKKKLGLQLLSDKTANGERRYRIAS